MSSYTLLAGVLKSKPEVVLTQGDISLQLQSGLMHPISGRSGLQTSIFAKVSKGIMKASGSIHCDNSATRHMSIANHDGCCPLLLFGSFSEVAGTSSARLNDGGIGMLFTRRWSSNRF